jgi:hypothetical protein
MGEMPPPKASREKREIEPEPPIAVGLKSAPDVYPLLAKGEAAATLYRVDSPCARRKGEVASMESVMAKIVRFKVPPKIEAS